MAWPNGVRPEPEAPPEVKASGYNGRPDPELLREMNRLIESGPFRVLVARTFSLGEADEAHRALQEHYVGKLAIRVREE